MNFFSSRRSVTFAAPFVFFGALLATGCEDKEAGVATTGPSGTAGSGNRAGAAGTSSGGSTAAGSAGASAGSTAGGTGGSAGAMGGASGKGGSAGATGGASGQGGATGGASGKGGSAGSTGGASGKGGAAGATGGSAGAAGKAGASGNAGAAGSSALPPIGSACTSDAACGNGNACLLPDGKDFLGGGPTNGLCVKDCTAAGTACATGSTCVPFGEKKYCMESCTYGTPPLPEGPSVDVPEDKCHGRLDLSCAPLGGTTKGACVPRCWPAQDGVEASDLCPGGTTCDPTKGVCVATASLPAGLLRNGAACSPNVDARQCLGNCIPLNTDGNTGICAEPCSGAVAESCGGLDAGLCFLDTEGVTGVNSGLILFGPLDVAGCAMSVGPTEDAKCLWQAGWFPVSFAFPDKTRAYCLPAGACTGDADCVETCKEQKDCSHPDAACTAGKCTVNDTCQTVGTNKYCLDHAPTVP